MTRTHARHDAREAVELRQYNQLLKSVQQAARAYQRRTGCRINWTDTTPQDIAADAYIIALDEPTRPGDSPGDKLRRAAYEAVRRAARGQQRHAHADLPTDQDTDAAAPPGDLDTIDIRQAIQQAGHVAQLIAAGWDTTTDISRRLGVSVSTAWRLMERARQAVRQGLDISGGK